MRRARRLGPRTAAEHEASALLRVPIDAALAALPAGAVRNGPLIVALQWLALNRGRLAEIARAGTTSR
jgi:ADP-ribose pyrophosphatase